MNIVYHIADLLADSDSDKRIIIGISGPPGAGKSTLARDIQHHLQEHSVNSVIAQADAFSFSDNVLSELNASDRKGAPDTFDIDGYVHLLNRLKNANKTVYIPSFSTIHATGVVGDVTASPDTRVVIAEGSYLGCDDHGWDQVRPLLDELYYLDGDVNVLHRRLLGEQLSQGKSLQEAENWITKVGLPNVFLVKNTKGNATRIK